MYKFFGEPLKEIKSKTSNKTIFRFDTKGEFITDDEEIIKRALGYFDYLVMKAEPIGNKVEKTVVVPITTITTKSDELKTEIKEETKEIRTFNCKKCTFECDSQGTLMRHYKDVHPKN